MTGYRYKVRPTRIHDSDFDHSPDDKKESIRINLGDKFATEEKFHLGPKLFGVEVYSGFLHWTFILFSTSFSCIDSFPKDN